MSSKRRDKGEGSVFLVHDKQGRPLRYAGYVSLGYRSGKPKRQYKYGRLLSKGGTKREITDWLREASRRKRNRLPVAEDRQPLSEFMWQDFRNRVVPNLAENSRINYEKMIRLYIEPKLGHIEVGDLRPNDVRELMAWMRKAGKSPKTIQIAHAVLRAALHIGVNDEVLIRNVASIAQPPRSPKTERAHLSLELCQQIRGAIEKSPYRCALTLLIWTGLRRNELRGLRWRNVDFKRHRVLVRHQWSGREFRELKSTDSRRDVPMTAILESELLLQRKTQAEHRLVAGELWQALDVVCPNAIGYPAGTSTWWKHLQRALVSIGAERVSLHALRHTYTSLLRKAGVDIETARKILGHSRQTMTLHYTHTDEDAFDDAGARLESLTR